MKFKYFRLTCQEATFLITKKQETKLTSWEKFKLYFHQLACKSCERFAQQMVLLDASVMRFFKASAEKGHQFSVKRKASLEKMIEDNQ
jgi:hypothetical protein